MTANTEEKINNLFKNYPCVRIKYRLFEHQNQLKSLIFNEKYINEIGYNVEGFTSTIMNEGIPQ